LEQLNNLSETFSVVGNETGELEGWSVPKAEVARQKGLLEAEITQLDILSKELLEIDD